jgi:nitrite reductase/ring-hydroxylating ferredoxin subunit/DMSO/TMAO reductase YedYZ heme-binding membrane subunit
MSANYAPVLWNRQKKIYDRVMFALMGFYLVVFVALQLFLFPEITLETLIIRATGTLAFLMLHIILCIGPLTRIDKRFLPLLYNRRHLGVAMCCVALIHGVFNLIQFHALGNVDPLVSLFTSNPNYGSFGRFPFEVFGFFALVILMLMASTSHDFWLKNLSPKVWKTLHMMVYWAYAMLVMHVMLGVIQLEKSAVMIGVVGVGMVAVVGLHVWAGHRKAKVGETGEMGPPSPLGFGGRGEMSETSFIKVCRVEEIAENRAKTVMIDGENIAIFKYENKLSAINNLCRHQNGPLGEGKIIDGCITCPWHGYQYLPHNGQSPPPFTEKVETYDVQLIDGWVYVNPNPYPEGTERPPCPIDHIVDQLNNIAEKHEQ